jgi:phenylalanyl-tRNA synthetase beta chain
VLQVPANRYDLLCPDGLARAFRIFLGIEQPPVFTATPTQVSLTVRPEVTPVRRFMVCAVLRGVDFKKRPGLFQEFLDLQDKLHTNICRKRKLVSIGTHDLDKCLAPFVYSAESPQDIRFVPLQRKWMGDDVRGKSMDAKALFALLRQVGDPCADYLHLIEGSDKVSCFFVFCSIFPKVTSSGLFFATRGAKCCRCLRF